MTKTADGLYEYNPRPYGGHERLLGLLPRPGRVLDVGCSTGYLARRLRERGSEVVGIEIDERAAEQAKRFCEEVYVGDVESMELPFAPRTFDAVVCGDLIEHLRDPEQFLVRIRPLLREPDGRLVLSTPNIANWAMRIGLLFGRFRYTEWGILDRTHTRLFTVKTLTETLEATGYRVAETDLTVPVPLFSTRRVEAIAHWIGRARPSLFAYQLLVAAVADPAARTEAPAPVGEPMTAI